MEPERLLIWVCFAFCLGLTAGGVLIFFRLKVPSGLPAVRYFQYYLVMMYVYGFYSIWSDVLIHLFFAETNGEDELISGISHLLLLVSMPFLLIGIIVLFIWARRIVKRKAAWILFAAAGIAIVLSLIAWWLIPFSLSRTEDVLMLLTMTAILFVASQIFITPLHYLNNNAGLLMASLLLGFGSLQVLPATGLTDNLYIELGFVLLYFFLNSAMGTVLVYAGEFPAFRSASVSFSGFVKEYGITNREKEIIAEIYKGKTNREIAETLFVTVQTIKDHTHRIYQKTAVKNRHQLTRLLHSLKEKQTPGENRISS